MLGELERGIADEAMDAGLGGRVGGTATMLRRPGCALAGAGRHADDGASALLHHQPHGFGKTENGVGRFAARVAQILDGEKRAINVVVTVNQEQLHRQDRIN